MGFLYTPNLDWKLKIKKIILKVSKNLNILRATCGIEWGADPIPLKIFCNGIIKSQFDLGSLLLQPCSEFLEKKLTIYHNKALRIITGCMRSTPVSSLQCETSEIPLEIRKKILACKFALKVISYLRHPVRSIMFELGMMNIRQTIWKKTKIQYVVLLEIKNVKNLFYTSSIFPCYKINIENQITPMKWAKFPYTSPLLNGEFTECKQSKFQNFNMIYTDGLKTKEGSGGIGVHIPKLQINFSSKVY